MNLADAIRQAAGQLESQPRAAATETIHFPYEPKEASAPAASTTMSTPNIQLGASSEMTESSPATFGNFLRIELFLAPEQLSALLSAVVKTQHSVLTLREAASFLRLPLNTVEQLAIEKKLPAFAIEGKWRFSHSALEEWLNSHHVSETTPGKELL